MFRGIQKTEWKNLFDFIQSKRLRIENLREAELGPAGGGVAAALDLGDDIDTGERGLPPHLKFRSTASGSTSIMQVLRA